VASAIFCSPFVYFKSAEDSSKGIFLEGPVSLWTPFGLRIFTALTNDFVPSAATEHPVNQYLSPFRGRKPGPPPPPRARLLKALERLQFGTLQSGLTACLVKIICVEDPLNTHKENMHDGYAFQSCKKQNNGMVDMLVKIWIVDMIVPGFESGCTCGFVCDFPNLGASFLF